MATVVSGRLFMVGAGLCVAVELAATAIGGDAVPVKATGLAAAGCGCMAAATGASWVGLLWRPM